MTIVVSECCVYCFAEVAGHSSHSYGWSATARKRVNRKNTDGSIIIILYPLLTTSMTAAFAKRNNIVVIIVTI